MACRRVAAFSTAKRGRSVTRFSKFIVGCILSICVTAPIPVASAAATPAGVWLMGTTLAIQTFNCGEMLCGRVIWLKAPLNPQGLLKRDTLNPDPALRERQICGPTIIWNLRPAGAGHWKEGWFYNADDGATYRLAMELKSADVMIVRAYLGVPLFGETRTLVRIPMGTAAGWC